jgi:chromosome segregation ATPase
MSQDVTQWLAEIKLLRQQLTEAQQERDRAYASAANWQKLYETEAQQRRTEAALSQHAVQQLQQEIAQLRQRLTPSVDEAKVTAAIAAEVTQLQTVEGSKDRLIVALQECDRLVRALQTEQDHHAQTRKSLTMALGDAIDMLSKNSTESPTS